MKQLLILALLVFPLTVTLGQSEAPIIDCEALANDPTRTVPLLSWTRPLTRSDGSPLPEFEIDSYKVYSGLDPQNLALSGTTKNICHLPTDIITTQGVNTYYFVVITTNVFGAESDFSEVVSAKVYLGKSGEIVTEGAAPGAPGGVRVIK